MAPSINPPHSNLISYFYNSTILNKKAKFTLEQETKAQRVSRGFFLSSTSTLDCEWVVNATPRPLYAKENPATHCIGGWLGPTAGLNGWGKSRTPPGFDPRTVQPAASAMWIRTEWHVTEHGI